MDYKQRIKEEREADKVALKVDLLMLQEADARASGNHEKAREIREEIYKLGKYIDATDWGEGLVPSTSTPGRRERARDLYERMQSRRSSASRTRTRKPRARSPRSKR